jgi:Putative peptidoglycan binding domain
MHDIDRARFEMDQMGGLRTFEWEQAPRPTTAPAGISTAVVANRRLAVSLGWGCIVAGRVRAMLGVRILLGLPCEVTESEANLAAAVASWQRGQGLPPNGELDARTWQRMQQQSAALRVGRFEPRQWAVRHRGAVLGVIDKLAPYQLFYVDAAGQRSYGTRPANPVVGGAQLEVGFRITSQEGVRRAGFERFRWIQTVEYIWDRTPRGAWVRRAGRAVDPLPRSTPQHLIDPHPYYWDEVVLPGADPLLHVNCYLRRPVPANRFCYDLLFFDAAQAPFSFAQPGHRYWANYELALVGVRSGSAPAGRTRNVVLTTVNWGFDIVVERGIPIVKLNALAGGVHGGSAEFKRVLNREMSRGSYPTHCFLGTGWGPSARCR